MSPPRLKILCLHGFTSNGTVHAHQVRRITKALPEYEFVFPDGPHTVGIASQMDLSKPASQPWVDLVSSMSESGHRAWWFAEDSEDGTIGEFKGFDETMEYLGKLMHEKGPFHGIWGFSQGAGVAGMLCALLQQNLSSHPVRKYFSDIHTPLAGIIFSGFRARFHQYDSLYAKGIKIPTMHVIGANDTSVLEERSVSLAKVCHEPQILRHENGHNIPRGDEPERQIVDFVRQHIIVTSEQPKQASI